MVLNSNSAQCESDIIEASDPLKASYPSLGAGNTPSGFLSENWPIAAQ